MKRSEAENVVRSLLDERGETFAEQAGIRLRNTPQPLFQLLVLSLMLSARIASDNAVSAAHALFKSGLRSPKRLNEAKWQERVDAITDSGYKRYDEKGASQLGDTAAIVLRDWAGDLRSMRKEADGDVKVLQSKLTKCKGVGQTGADIFIREVQAVWPEFYPYADRKVLGIAEDLNLPSTPEKLCELCSQQEFPRLTAALVRVRIHREIDHFKSAA